MGGWLPVEPLRAAPTPGVMVGEGDEWVGGCERV